MEFKKYPSLTNHYAIGKDRRIVEKLDSPWYSTEKIHGANAAYYLDKDGNEKFAKRSEFIDFESKDKQFNALPSCISLSIKEATKAILDYTYAEYAIVYGEYFGSGVQSMEYDICKNKEKGFLVFDVFIKHRSYSDDEFYVLGVTEKDSFYKEKDLAPFKQYETLRELLSKEADEESLLGGFSEGEVYKLCRGYKISENNRFVGVKHKTEKYLEKEKVSTKQPKSKPNWGIEELEIRSELGNYITLNQVRNVLSHGEFELIPQNIGGIMQAVKDDAIEEYVRETERVISDNVDFGALINGYSKDVASFIKELIQEDTLKAIS